MMFSTLFLAVSVLFIEYSLQASPPSFSDVLSTSQYNLSSFSDVLKKKYPDLLTRISGQSTDSPITVLAPSDAAFAKTAYYPIIGPAFSDNDIDAIHAILDYHVVVGDYPTTSLETAFQYLPTWLTNSSTANVTGGQRVGGVMQSGKDMFWVSGQSNRSPGIVTDISFEGGTVHVIDSLLIPPTSFPSTSELFEQASEPNQLTSFLGATYYHAVNETVANIAPFLNTSSDITIFVPNNIAMETVSGALTTMPKDKLAAVLGYHIIASGPTPWYSTNFSTTNSTILTTLAGQPLTITFSSNSFFVNSARLLTSDLLIENGVMHVIDNVLSPDQEDTKPVPSIYTQAPVLSTGGAFNISEAPFTTFLPNLVTTASRTTTVGGGYGAKTTSTTTTAGAATSKALGGRVELEVGWMGVLGVVGVIAGVV